MSNYALGVLVNGQTTVTKKYQSAEQRRQMPTIMELALKNQSISIPNAQELRTSPLRPVDIHYLTNIAAGAATAKTYNHTGNMGDSAKINVTYVTHVETFKLPRKMGVNNVFKYQQLFNNMYEMAWKNLRTRHDNSALSYLYANRCQIDITSQITSAFNTTPTSPWNTNTYALEIQQTDNKMLMQRIMSLMEARLFEGPLDIIADLQTSAWFSLLMNQGGGNETNYAYQYGGNNIAKTSRQIDTNYANGAVIALPAGQFAGLNWNEELNVKGDETDAGGPVGIFTTRPDPFGSGAIADVSMYSGRADTSADTTGGSTQDVVDEWEITLTTGYVLPPLSTASDSVAHEIALI